MSVDIDSIKRKLLIKYPTFGSIIAKLEFQENKEITTAGTDGKVVIYNPEFVRGLSEKEQTFLFAHEVCHVAFEHIFRSEGKDKMLWNIATDAVINALLKQDGLPIFEGGIDIPEAVNYDAEEMYNKLLEEKKKQENQEQQQEEKDGQTGQNSQDEQGEQNMQGNKEEQSSQSPKGEGSSQEGEGQTDVGHDTHSLWEKAIEERKTEEKRKQNSKKSKLKKAENDKRSVEEKEDLEEKERKIKDFIEKGEKEIFKQNKSERRRQLQELNKVLAKETAQGAGISGQGQEKKIADIGVAKPVIDWRKLLRQAVKYEEEYTRKNARMRNGYFRHKLQEIPIPETEIVLDISGSVSENLLRNFLRECKNIFANSKVKVGCFNTRFHGFKELRRVEDIDNMSFPIGGGTNFNAAVNAFSKRVPNKIIFTDGEAPMPYETVRNVIWVVYGNRQINPKGGKVINIEGEQLRRLYKSEKEDMSR